jgi:hypothetical protein
VVSDGGAGMQALGLHELVALDEQLRRSILQQSSSPVSGQ